MSQTLVAEGQAPGPSAPANGGKGAMAPVTFTYTGGEQTYTVPAGVSALEVQAVGADGGSQDPDQVSGGTGGMVIGELAVGSGTTAVTPGRTLYVAVGGSSDDGQGGFNGGGTGGSGAGGGAGATDVRTCSPTSASCANGVSSLLTRLIIAAGGGGAGDSDARGAGGSAGQPGSDSPFAPGSGLAGGAGTLRAPGGARSGEGATPGGLDGSGGQGASVELGGSAGGGGGGAGYFGGGGGSVGRAIDNGRAENVSSGGGGGASFASPFVVSGVSLGLGDGTARLLITPRPASTVRVSMIYYNSPGPDTGSNKSLNAEFVRLTNVSGTVQQLRGWTISDSTGHVYRFGPLGLQPGQSVTVHTGHGRDSPKARYWNRRGYAWDNTRDLVRVHTADGTLADQCRYDDSHTSQLRC